MEGPARMPCQPLRDLRVIVGGAVVQDRADLVSGWHRGLDGVEEADELLVPVALHTAADDRAVQYVPRREQRGGAVALVVRHGAAAPFLQRQAGRGAVERLDLAFSSTDGTTA